MSSQSAVLLGTNYTDMLQDFQAHPVLIFQTSGERRLYGGFCS